MKDQNWNKGAFTLGLQQFKTGTGDGECTIIFSKKICHIYPIMTLEPPFVEFRIRPVASAIFFTRVSWMKDDMVNLYLGINRKPSPENPILARCLSEPTRNTTGLGIFIDANREVKIKHGILYHIRSEDKQDEGDSDSTIIYAAVLNKSMPFKLLNLHVSVHQQTPRYHQTKQLELRPVPFQDKTKQSCPWSTA